MPKKKTVITKAKSFRIHDVRIDRWIETLPHGELTGLVNMLLERYVKEQGIKLEVFEDVHTNSDKTNGIHWFYN